MLNYQRVSSCFFSHENWVGYLSTCLFWTNFAMVEGDIYRITVDYIVNGLTERYLYRKPNLVTWNTMGSWKYSLPQILGNRYFIIFHQTFLEVSIKMMMLRKLPRPFYNDDLNINQGWLRGAFLSSEASRFPVTSLQTLSIWCTSESICWF